MSLAWRSILVLALLFGLVFAVGIAVLWYVEAPLWLAIGWAVGIVGLQYLLGPFIIELVFKIRWVSPSEYGAEVAEFIADTCRRWKIPMPRLGIIEDGNPNAFTFGHYPGNARVVITRGLLDMLPSDGVKAVVAHELGHIKHWDFVVMTVAAVVPAILYVLYRWSVSGRQRKGGAIMVAIGAYIAYVLSQFIVLLLSRIREYYADRFSVGVTRQPQALASSLVSIVYGLARMAGYKDPSKSEKQKKESERLKPQLQHAFSSLGISATNAAPGFLLTSLGAHGFSIDVMRRALRWDLYNPWARWLELFSTHPITSLRIKELEDFGERFGIPRRYTPHEYEREPVRWNLFMRDMVVATLPYVAAAFGALFALGTSLSMSYGSVIWLGGWAATAFGIGQLGKLFYVYRMQDFHDAKVVDLLGEVDVSPITPIPVRLHGIVIGRGIPGLYWSEDLVLHDGSGFIVLDYKQPLAIWEVLFGWLKAGSFIGREAVVTGWFRRTLRPYVEVKHIDIGPPADLSQFGADADERFQALNADRIEATHKRTTCYYYIFRFAGAALITIIGVVLIAMALTGVMF